MKLSHAALVFLGLLAMQAVPGQESSSLPAKPSSTITLVREDADVREIISTIAKASGANIVVAPEVTGIVTLHLREVPWRAALDAAVKTANASIIEEDHGILRVIADAPPRTQSHFTIAGPKNFLAGYPAQNEDGTVNVVVEIPTGTLAKWEVDKVSGTLRWEFKNGAPRIVDYLGYPGNYGMVPRTLLSKELGGDGDPLDVIVLGPAVGRGDVVPVRIIGVIELLDSGEQDDKLVAVLGDSPMARIKSMRELEEAYPGALSIVETWFANYKGPGSVEIRGRSERSRALEILNQASAAFEKSKR